MIEHVEHIIQSALATVMPGEAVREALADAVFPGRVLLVAVGKAAWAMAEAALGCCAVERGVVITKYGHGKGPLPGILCLEAGHPVPDSNGLEATERVLELVSGLKETDTVLFLLSGGGSALFEKPLISGAELADVTQQLLRCGADIVEINTIRKRLSAVKGGRFAQLCRPAQVYSVVLSDIVGDPLDMIASGPACADRSTCAQAEEIAMRYGLRLSEQGWACLRQETPKELNHVTTKITGSVRILCAAAAKACRELGYETVVLTDSLTCEAGEAGRWLGGILRDHRSTDRPLAFVAGGETVVHVTGSGLGGRNQELALAAALELEGLERTVLFSIGSDGTDGPTDAAGAWVDGATAGRMRELGIDAMAMLADHDSYHALDACGCLIRTGPTGTNVNDVTVGLIGAGERP